MAPCVLILTLPLFVPVALGQIIFGAVLLPPAWAEKWEQRTTQPRPPAGSEAPAPLKPPVASGASSGASEVTPQAKAELDSEVERYKLLTGLNNGPATNYWSSFLKSDRELADELGLPSLEDILSGAATQKPATRDQLRLSYLKWLCTWGKYSQHRDIFTAFAPHPEPLNELRMSCDSYQRSLEAFRKTRRCGPKGEKCKDPPVVDRVPNPVVEAEPCDPQDWNEYFRKDPIMGALKDALVSHMKSEKGVYEDEVKRIHELVSVREGAEKKSGLVNYALTYLKAKKRNIFIRGGKEVVCLVPSPNLSAADRAEIKADFLEYSLRRPLELDRFPEKKAQEMRLRHARGLVDIGAGQLKELEKTGKQPELAEFFIRAANRDDLIPEIKALRTTIKTKGQQALTEAEKKRIEEVMIPLVQLGLSVGNVNASKDVSRALILEGSATLFVVGRAKGSNEFSVAMGYPEAARTGLSKTHGAYRPTALLSEWVKRLKVGSQETPAQKATPEIAHYREDIPSLPVAAPVEAPLESAPLPEYDPCQPKKPPKPHSEIDPENLQRIMAEAIEDANRRGELDPDLNIGAVIIEQDLQHWGITGKDAQAFRTKWAEVLQRYQVYACRLKQDQALTDEERLLMFAREINFEFTQAYSKRDNSILQFLSAEPEGNCVASSKLVLSLLHGAKLRVPKGKKQGVQLFFDHLEPVLVDQKKGELTSLVFGSTTQQIRGPVMDSVAMLGLSRIDGARTFFGVLGDVDRFLHWDLPKISADKLQRGHSNVPTQHNKGVEGPITASIGAGMVMAAGARPTDRLNPYGTPIPEKARNTWVGPQLPKGPEPPMPPAKDPGDSKDSLEEESKGEPSPEEVAEHLAFLETLRPLPSCGPVLKALEKKGLLSKLKSPDPKDTNPPGGGIFFKEWNPIYIRWIHSIYEEHQSGPWATRLRRGGTRGGLMDEVYSRAIRQYCRLSFLKAKLDYERPYSPNFFIPAWETNMASYGTVLDSTSVAQHDSDLEDAKLLSTIKGQAPTELKTDRIYLPRRGNGPKLTRDGQNYKCSLFIHSTEPYAASLPVTPASLLGSRWPSRGSRMGCFLDRDIPVITYPTEAEACQALTTGGTLHPRHTQAGSRLVSLSDLTSGLKALKEMNILGFVYRFTRPKTAEMLSYKANKIKTLEEINRRLAEDPLEGPIPVYQDNPPAPRYVTHTDEFLADCLGGRLPLPALRLTLPGAPRTKPAKKVPSPQPKAEPSDSKSPGSGPSGGGAAGTSPGLQQVTLLPPNPPSKADKKPIGPPRPVFPLPESGSAPARRETAAVGAMALKDLARMFGDLTVTRRARVVATNGELMRDMIAFLRQPGATPAERIQLRNLLRPILPQIRGIADAAAAAGGKSSGEMSGLASELQAEVESVQAVPEGESPERGSNPAK